MKFEIDQSGKIERTQVDTVIALSNDDDYAILILGVEKRELLKKLRSETGYFPFLQVFTAALFILLKGHLRPGNQFIIDQEYSGHGEEIKRQLIKYIKSASPKFPEDNIEIRKIGKKSRAHVKAIAIYRRDTSPDKVVRAREILRALKITGDSSSSPLNAGRRRRTKP